MAIFLYARVSTIDQDTALQETALKEKYPDAVYREEKRSGTSMKKREALSLILDMIGKGDKLVVWKLDRLARDMNDLTNIVSTLEQRGAHLEILNQAIDTSTPGGKAFMQMLGVFAEFETNLRSERQMAGIKAAKAKGKHCGRKATLTDKQQQEIRDKRTTGKTPTELSKEYGVSRATIYNILKEVKNMSNKEILPTGLRTKIMGLFDKKYESSEILDEVREEAAPHVEDDAQLKSCIAAIKGHHSKGHNVSK